MHSIFATVAHTADIQKGQAHCGTSSLDVDMGLWLINQYMYNTSDLHSRFRVLRTYLGQLASLGLQSFELALYVGLFGLHIDFVLHC